MPNDVADLEPAMAKLVAILPNKVGLDKEYASADTQAKNVEADTTNDDIKDKDTQTNNATALASETASKKAKK